MYNILIDLAILGTTVAALFATIHYLDKRKAAKPYPKHHMIDQKRRYKHD